MNVLVYVMGSMPPVVPREEILGPRGVETLAALTGLGIGVELTETDGRSVDAATVAEWSARVDLSQSLWVNAGNLAKQFVEEIDDPAPDREERLRDWLTLAAFSRAFQEAAAARPEPSQAGEEPHRPFEATELFEALDREVEEHEAQQK